MLILSRKQGESINIADNIEVTVSRISGNRVTLGVKAPGNVRIVRNEIQNAEPKRPRGYGEPGVLPGEICNRFKCAATITTGRDGVCCPACGWDSTRDE